MRISDWSSDVCSSDLGHRELPPFALFDAVEQLVVDHAALLHTLGRGRGGLPQQHFAKPRVGRAVQNGALVLAVLRQAVDLLTFDRKRALVLVDAVAVEHPDFRSEEHTSELQSLMRISYAVFCLKKKKHNNTSRDRH